MPNGVPTIALKENYPLDNCPEGNCLLPPPEQLPLRKIASVENCPPENCSLDDFSGKIIPKIIVPLTIFPWKFSPRKIAFRMICCQRNSPEENCPPQEHCPKDKLHTIYFFPKNQKSQDFNR